MGITGKLKNFYYFFEDKYYSMLDQIDKAIPIYKVIDPIDKIFPSFILFIIVLIAIIALVVFMVGGTGWSLFPSGSLTAKILVRDEANAKISGATLTISFLEEELSKTTDSNGEAIIEIPNDDIEATISVQKTGFDPKQGQSVTLSSKTPVKITLKKSLLPPLKKYNLAIVDSETNEDIAVKVSAIFHCSGTGTPPSRKETTNSEMTGIEPPENCGTLTAEFSAEGYETVSGFRFTKENDTLRMWRKKGSIEVTVTDTIGGVADAELLLLKNGYTETDSGTTTSTGNYLFENVSPGTYKISATADDGRSGISEEIEVEADETSSAEILLGAPIPKEDQKKIFIFVKDANSGQAVSSAKIIVFAGSTPFDSSESDSDGLYSKIADNTKTYSIAISKDGYITRSFSSIPLKSTDDTEPTPIALIAITNNPQNYAQILAHVFDEENNSIKNAEVLLYKSSIPGLILNYPKSLTDNDGNVLFTSLEAGDYNLKVTSGSQHGEAGITIATGQTGFVNIKIVVGEGTAEATIKDSSTGAKIISAAVSYVDSETRQVVSSCTTNLQGTCESGQLKASTRVFAKATATGFLPGISNAMQIIRNTKATTTIELDPEDTYPADGNVIVEFKALCSDEKCNTKINRIDSSAEVKFYYAKFNLILPTRNVDYNSIFMHISVGPEQATFPGTGWLVKIMNVNVPTYDSIEYSKCYDAANLYAAPENCTADNESDHTNEKQAVISWNSLERIVIPIIAKIKIENGLEAGTEIEFRAIAKARISNVDFESAPKKIIYRIGEASCASSGFAWAIGIKDPQGNSLAMPAGANAEMAKGTNYSLDYLIINCTRNDITNAKLQLQNIDTTGEIDSLHPLDLTVGTSTGQGPLTALEKPFFFKNTEISSQEFGAIGITPLQETSLTKIAFDLLGENAAINDVSSHYEVPIAIVPAGTMEIITTAGPIVLTSPTIQITGSVIDALDSSAIQGARVTLRRADNGAQIGAYSRDTDAQGTFTMTITSSYLAGLTKIKLRVEKANYRAVEKEIALTTILTSDAINQNFKCIQINDESVLDDSMAAKTITLPGAVKPYSYHTVKLSVASNSDCQKSMEIELAYLEGPKSPVAKILGSTEALDSVIIAPGETKAIIIGSNSGTDGKNPGAIQGEYPIIIKARIAGQGTKVPVATIRANFADSANETGCFTVIDKDGNPKFAYDIKTNDNTGTIANACAVATSNTEYPKAKIGQSALDSPVALNTQSTAITGTWKVTVTNVQPQTGTVSFLPSDGAIKNLASIDNYDKITGAFNTATSSLGIFTEFIPSGSASPDDLIIFLDGADNQIKAMLAPKAKPNIDFTLERSRLGYGLLEYTDLVNPAAYLDSPEQIKPGNKIDAQATIRAYKFSGNKIVSAGSNTIGAAEINANGLPQKIADKVPDSLASQGGQFFVVSNTNNSRNLQVVFKNGNNYSNVSFDAGAKIYAIPPDYSKISHNIDLVFAVDTSRSAGTLWQNLCKKITGAKQELENLGFEARIKIYPIGSPKSSIEQWIENQGEDSCSGLDIDETGTSGTWTEPSPILNPANMQPAQNHGGYDHNTEAWGPAINEILEKTDIFPALPDGKNSNKMLIAVVDNDPTGKRCVDNYEHVECAPQWRLDAVDGNPSINNEIPFVESIISNATAKDTKLFFFYGYPINHNTMEEVSNYTPSTAINDVAELYNYAATATGGVSEPFGSANSDGEKLAQMLLASILPKATQKFQLRTDSGTETQCRLGEKTGSTGESSAMPKVKFSWKWIYDEQTKAGIRETNCDIDDSEGIYCDQAQFYIELLKKLHQLSEWGKNTGEITANNSTVQKFLNFDAYLIEDTYSQKFKFDFVNYYQQTGGFLDTPQWFRPDSSERWDNYLKNAKFKVIIDGTEISSTRNKQIDAGLYHVSIQPEFPSQNWIFFDSSGEGAATIKIIITKTEPPQYDSPFYHMAIDGAIGMENPNSGRHDSLYGTKFTALTGGAALALGDEITTSELTEGSGAAVSVEQISDFAIINDSMRGMLLSVKYDKATWKPQEIKFLPSKAMPIASKVVGANRTAILDYYLKDNEGIAISGLGSIASWSLFSSENGSCKDLSGNALMEAPDSELSGLAGCHSNTYGFIWPNAANAKSMYLDALLFVPNGINMSLSKSCPAETVPSEFYALNSSSLAEGGTKATINRQNSSLDISDSPFSISKIGGVFEGVKNRFVCVDGKANGQVDFFWNQSALSEPLISKIEFPEGTGCGW